MNATHKALAMIGMDVSEMERMDFFKRSGRKAAAALRSLGYTQERFPTYAGNAVTRWAKDSCPMTMDEYPAFNVLVMAIAETTRTNA
jgi:hypothetical protein